MNDQVVEQKQTELDSFHRGIMLGLRLWLMNIHAMLDCGPEREVISAMAEQLHRIANRLHYIATGEHE